MIIKKKKIKKKKKKKMEKAAIDSAYLCFGLRIGLRS